ncbi:WhiB family transcriptional regulator [Citricoccus sp. K5]|uniref:WhiB family transcriptional regulator n=1 Tax=Citricoccus sp. K5 TaxID=2653135 RepID=UPI0012F3DC70|nr:WhiB family transcriptional regulator [Citricoccus sp. K5]VXB24063.1 hypothetical protein CITRIK5_30020 [Citricoccus sp. K5]
MTYLMDDTTDAAVLTPCRQDPEQWFPAPGGTAPIARALCQTCPVIDACLEAALDFEGDARRADRFGVWGGMSPQERADEAVLRLAMARLKEAA